MRHSMTAPAKGSTSPALTSRAEDVSRVLSAASVTKLTCSGFYHCWRQAHGKPKAGKLVCLPALVSIKIASPHKESLPTTSQRANAEGTQGALSSLS